MSTHASPAQDTMMDATPAVPNPVSIQSQYIDEAPRTSSTQTVAIISCVTVIAAIGNLLAGLLTVCIPVISSDLGISASLQLWPVSAYALACGCTLLPCGAVTDVLGCRRMCLFGAFLQSCSALGSGLATTPTQLIVFRSAAGVAASFCLPAAVGVCAHVFPTATEPRRRTAAFAAMGGGQAVGFGIGLVLGGVCADSIGWRWGFHVTTVLNALVLIVAFLTLPTTVDDRSLNRSVFLRIRSEVDWVGALLISLSAGLLSYELAVFTTPDASENARKPVNIVLLTTAMVLLPAFAVWMKRQTRLGRPALIPNALWTKKAFSVMCLTVFLVWGSLNASEQLMTIYLQDVRGVSAKTTSLYFLPAPLCGALMNVVIGASLPHLRASIAVPVICAVSAVAPILLAVLCDADGPSYWKGLFQAVALGPLGADVIYTVANLVITSAFPSKTQALAGGVFNMLAQLGKSMGIATTALVARQVTDLSDQMSSEGALVHGYKAGWWYNFAMGAVAVFLSV